MAVPGMTPVTADLSGIHKPLLQALSFVYISTCWEKSLGVLWVHMLFWKVGLYWQKEVEVPGRRFCRLLTWPQHGGFVPLTVPWATLPGVEPQMILQMRTDNNDHCCDNTRQTPRSTPSTILTWTYQQPFAQALAFPLHRRIQKGAWLWRQGFNHLTVPHGEVLRALGKHLGISCVTGPPMERVLSTHLWESADWQSVLPLWTPQQICPHHSLKWLITS